MEVNKSGERMPLIFVSTRFIQGHLTYREYISREIIEIDV